MAQEKAMLIYVGDPLCSWCYGFSPEISKVKERLKDRCDFQLVMGGLRPYNTETMADLGEFLKDHWQHVSDRSSVEFNYDILKDHTFVYDTEPPARAVVVVRQLSPSNAFAFFKEVQKAFYAQNKNTNQIDTYLEMLPQYGIDQKTFAELFHSNEMKALVKADFQHSASLGVRGFPGTILKVGDQYYQTSNGFVEAETLIQTIQGILEESLKKQSREN